MSDTINTLLLTRPPPVANTTTPVYVVGSCRSLGGWEVAQRLPSYEIEKGLYAHPVCITEHAEYKLVQDGSVAPVWEQPPFRNKKLDMPDIDVLRVVVSTWDEPEVAIYGKIRSDFDGAIKIVDFLSEHLNVQVMLISNLTSQKRLDAGCLAGS